jgi:dipeptidyl aminopeptidase/acylaminoacyl peptidase
MGGQVTLRAMVVAKEIKAGVIWGGVVASYPDIISRWHHPAAADHVPSNHRGWRQEITEKYGTPEQNPAFWASISPNSYLADISGPLQLHHSTADAEVPLLFSDLLYAEAQAAGKEIEYYTYQGDNHNISANFTEAMQRSVAFFDKYVKGS